MKKIYTLFCLLSILSVQAQKLVIVPNDSVEVSETVSDYFDNTYLHIELKNNTVNTITITWGMLNYNAPGQWGLGLCDNRNCYDLLLNPGPYQSLAVNPGDTMDMKMQFTAHAVSGTGTTYVYAYITGDSTNSVVFLHYKGNVTYVSGIENNFADASIMLFPNPATNSLLVSGLKNADNLRFEIYDLKGAKLKSETKQVSGSAVEIDVDGLAGGEYLLKVLRGNKAVSAARFTKN